MEGNAINKGITKGISVNMMFRAMAGNDLIGMRDYLLALPRAFPSLPWFLHEEVVVQFFGASRWDRSVLSMIGGSIVVGQQIPKKISVADNHGQKPKRTHNNANHFWNAMSRARATRTIQNKFRFQNIGIQVCIVFSHVLLARV